MSQFWKLTAEKHDYGPDFDRPTVNALAVGTIFQVVEERHVLWTHSDPDTGQLGQGGNMYYLLEWKHGYSSQRGWVRTYDHQDVAHFAKLVHCDRPNDCDICVVEHVLTA